MKSFTQQIRALPRSPGVYFFRDVKNRVIYVGKANILSERVKQYFTQQAGTHPKISALRKEIAHIDCQLCESEVDALITEARFIKKYNPKFNVILRDDKNYFFVGITREPFPRIFITHQPDSTKQNIACDFIGPFTDGFAVKETLKHLRNVYPYRHCRTLPKKPCLQYHLGRCLAPCVKPEAKTHVRRNIKIITDILQGKRQAILKKLETQMKEAARKENFIKASELKKQIEGIQNIFSHTRFLERFKEIRREAYVWESIEKKLQIFLKTESRLFRVECYDISNISGKYAVGSMVVFENGMPAKSQYRRFKIRYSENEPNDPKMMAEVLSRRIRHLEWPAPDLIIVDGGITQLSAAQNILPETQLIMGLAKKQEELRAAHNPIPIHADEFGKDVLHFVQHIRDEAHRFAITYHRTLRGKLK